VTKARLQLHQSVMRTERNITEPIITKIRPNVWQYDDGGKTRPCTIRLDPVFNYRWSTREQRNNLIIKYAKKFISDFPDESDRRKGK